jgi:hypothetical protein
MKGLVGRSVDIEGQSLCRRGRNECESVIMVDDAKERIKKWCRAAPGGVRSLAHLQVAHRRWLAGDFNLQ